MSKRFRMKPRDAWVVIKMYLRLIVHTLRLVTIGERL